MPKNPQPHAKRVPPERAAGLDSEFTAQPRPLSDQLASPGAGEAGLSVDPDDLGAHFLSEATEQGEAIPRPAMEVELSLGGGSDSDEVLAPPHFARENTLWEQTVDLTLQTRNAADQLRAPPAFLDDIDGLDAFEERDADRPGYASSIRELSLFDRADASDEVDQVAPELAAHDDDRQRTRQADGARRVPRPAASSSDGSQAGPIRRALRAVLLRLAAMLRRFAEQKSATL